MTGALDDRDCCTDKLEYDSYADSVDIQQTFKKPVGVGAFFIIICSVEGMCVCVRVCYRS